MALTIGGLLGLDEEPRPLVAQHLELSMSVASLRYYFDTYLPRVAARRLLRLL